MHDTISDLEFALEDATDTTTSAFLVTALQWATDHAFWQPFTRLLDVAMKTVTYSPLAQVQTLIASIIIGCQFMKDVNSRLVPDPVAAAVLGLARFPDQSQLNVLLRRLDATNVRQLAMIHAEHVSQFESFARAASWADYLFVDIDQMGLVATGKTYELARKGYFPRRRGVQGYQLGAAFLGSSQITLALTLDPGNTHCTHRFPDLVQASEAQCAGAPGHPRVVFRVDAGYGGAPQIRWLVRTRRLFIAKSATKNAAKWAARVAPAAWQLVDGDAGVRVAEVAAGPYVRAIVAEVTDAHGVIHYAVVLSNLPAAVFAPAAIWRLYAERQTIEAFFKTGRGVYGVGNLRSREFTAIYGFLWLVFITHNLLQWVKKSLFAGTELAAIGTRELVEQLGRIPARRERTEQGWRLVLPAATALARAFVAALCPNWHQLTLPLRL